MYPNDFLEALNFTLEHEGGYSNKTIDFGGETIYGITKKYYPEYFDKITKAIENDEDPLPIVTEFYYKEIWQKYDCDKYRYPCNVVVFDSYTNLSPKTVNKIIQRALRLMGFYHGKIDGLLGPKSKSAIQQSLLMKNGSAILGQTICHFRKIHHLTFVRRYPSQRIFVVGWVMRVCRLETKCLKEIIKYSQS